MWLILQLMKMRELEARTGTNRETIRVYLRHGLVPAPKRPFTNVADYDETHVRAILAVRDLQRENGLTLRQIKETLKGRLGERRIEAGAFRDLEALVATRVGLDDRPIAIASLVKAFPFAEADARAFQSIGILDIVQTKAGPSLSVTDARLVTIWGEMRAAGYTEEIGFTTDILAFYIEPSEFVAGREAAIFLERTEGKISAEKAAAMLQSGLRIMLDFFGLLRTKAFMRNIHRAGPALLSVPRRKTHRHKSKRKSRPS
jgi:DNA-binding transcriptional MerR regulator